MIRSTRRTGDAIRSIGAALAAIDPSITVRYALLDTQIGESMLQERLMARLSAIFGGVALLLAIVGLYGVVSYTVASRRAEIGVRVALGASRSRILGMVLGDVGRMVAIGIAAGAAFALLAGRAVGSLLYGLRADGSGDAGDRDCVAARHQPHRGTAARQAGGRHRSAERTARAVSRRLHTD